ncbi:MAG: RsbRD N-terminal domain-containing protein [Desulfomonile tiedjei]|nr:RsbRD N-terminal domain-containing protein [Desulfomonile tiedjei]
MLEDFLSTNKTAILKRWLDLILETYPPDSRKFFATQQNRFANPVGANLSEGLEGLFDSLVHGTDPESDSFSDFLDKIVRIRAVQEFSPAKAVGFAFFLKTAVRESLAKGIHDPKLFQELLEFESRIDGVALLAFNIYMQCRETIFEMRATEIRNRVSRILERACQKYGNPSEWLDPKDDRPDSLT